jgi:5-hydroxyisourate hydrolase-like protein (transthyretin family)
MKALRQLLVALVCLLVPMVAFAGPPPFDPSAMSGQPRPDPKLPAGTVTVRCLGKAGFGDPKVGLEVTLAVRSSSGEMKSFKATTQEEGRATFSELADSIGGTAMASAQVGDAKMTSQPIRLQPNMGTAVLLVEGAAAAAAPAPAAPAHGQAGGPEIPPPGTAFPLRGTPAGTLTVGTFDLAARKPIDGVEITLTITPPSGEPIVRKAATAQGGKFVFDKLLPPDVPAGSKLVVEGTLRDVLRKSEPFEMTADAGMALVLAEGAEHFQAPPAAEQAPPEPAAHAQRTQLPAPRRMSQIPNGSVDVLVVDGNDRPVEGQRVTVIRETASGISGKYPGETTADGRARIDGIEVQQDAGYSVQVIYDGAPYQSGFFFMDQRGGVQVALRVFETTSDPKAVRSALRYDVDERENDLAQVVQLYEVMVQGDEAYWDPEFSIAAPAEAKGFTVLNPAEDWLAHKDEKAPFATLRGPIPPGEVANLSVAYLMPHDGAFELEWTPPFHVVQWDVLVRDGFTLTGTGAEASDVESPIPDKVVWTMPEIPLGSSLKFSMSGMKTQDPTFERIAIALGILIMLATFAAFAFVPRQQLRDRLLERRSLLLSRLAADPKSPDRERILRTLDRIYRQLDALRDHASPRRGGPRRAQARP